VPNRVDQFDKASEYVLGLSDAPISSNLFILNPVYSVTGSKDNGKYIPKDSFFEIRNHEGNLWLKADREFFDENNTETVIPVVAPHFQDSNVFRIVVAMKKDSVESQFL
jgi:hypothetical protein